VDTGDELILPIKRDDLAREPRPRPDKGVAWNGSAKLQYKARHLGIAAAPRFRWPDLNGVYSVLDEGWDAFAGSGFGHKCHVGDRQYYCWRGREIPRTAFEIAVTADPLTEAERRRLVK
jgi:hypothetical protein